MRMPLRQKENQKGQKSKTKSQKEITFNAPVF